MLGETCPSTAAPEEVCESQVPIPKTMSYTSKSLIQQQLMAHTFESKGIFGQDASHSVSTPGGPELNWRVGFRFHRFGSLKCSIDSVRSNFPLGGPWGDGLGSGQNVLGEGGGLGSIGLVRPTFGGGGGSVP